MGHDHPGAFRSFAFLGGHRLDPDPAWLWAHSLVDPSGSQGRFKVTALLKDMYLCGRSFREKPFAFGASVGPAR